MELATAPWTPLENNHPLIDRIIHCTKSIHHKLGSWEIVQTPGGAILTMSKCGLGDAAFLPQALHHGGLQIRRITNLSVHDSDRLSGKFIVGEITLSNQPTVSEPAPHPDSALTPEQAVQQSFSLLIHIFIPSSRAVATKFSQRLEIILSEATTTLQFKSWPGMIPHSETAKPRSTINLHLSTHPDFPLSPYEFEEQVLPLLRNLTKRVKQDSLLLRFDNPSTNLIVFCATEGGVLPKGHPCPGGHPHPG